MRLFHFLISAAASFALFCVTVAAKSEDSALATRTGKGAGLTLSCVQDNDLLQCLKAGGTMPHHCETPDQAIDQAYDRSAVLILADGYPNAPLRVSDATFAKATAKHLRVYIEYPESVPGIRFDAPRQISWERIVVASQKIKLGIPTLHLLTIHNGYFRPTTASEPSLVVARVAGMDHAVYGLPIERYPILFRMKDGTIVSTTKLSNFIKARYEPVADWRRVWQSLLAELDPAGVPHRMTMSPSAHPAYQRDEILPPDAEAQSVAYAAQWVSDSGLLVSKEREATIANLLRAGGEEISPPRLDDGKGDGSYGILEGYASRIGAEGRQQQRVPIRADCQAETAAVLAMHAALTNDAQSRRIATNLLKYLYFDSELHRGSRGDPHHPAFGLIAWGAFAPLWQIGNYGDDNARTLLATMAASASLKTAAWDASMLRALLANLRTTGRFGFRGDRVDMPPLEQLGWKHFHDSEIVNYSPHFEGYLWACFLWAYSHTHESEFLEKARSGIKMTMAAYPAGWRWGDNLERGHMLLPLAWLVRVENTAEHRSWLKRVATDLLAHQQPCGAIAEWGERPGAGHYAIPASNEAYGTGETPLIQTNGDPISDQLYTTGFVLLGLHEAYAATKDTQFKDAENRLADYLVRIQVRSDTIPFANGGWFRAFDFKHWGYWASSADAGWGVWCLESGWGPAWTAIVLGLRSQDTSLWEMTAASKIERCLKGVQNLMAENDGRPWQSKTAK